MKTFVPKPSEHKRKWYLVDANGKTLGRMATEIAKRIRGKDNPLFTPYYDMGASVVVINADKVRLTGKKESIKTYTWHTAYPRGLRSYSFKKQLPDSPIGLSEAVRGCSRNCLCRKLFLRFLSMPRKHPHTSRTPHP
jgi:large subunit ribosomal protein L13